MHAATITGYMKLIVDATPLAMLAYPISRVTEVMALKELRRTIFQTSLKESSRRVFFLQKAYTISTIPATSQRYESTSKFDSPRDRRAMLKRGEKPKEAEDKAA
jgi:hypothetical protein